LRAAFSLSRDTYSGARGHLIGWLTRGSTINALDQYSRLIEVSITRLGILVNLLWDFLFYILIQLECQGLRSQAWRSTVLVARDSRLGAKGFPNRRVSDPHELLGGWSIIETYSFMLLPIFYVESWSIQRSAVRDVAQAQKPLVIFMPMPRYDAPTRLEVLLNVRARYFAY